MPAARQFLWLAVLPGLQADAGEIPGLPASLPPTVERHLELVLSNDYFGNGGAVDDFRTQQIILAFRPGPRWSVLFDHSALTYYDAVNPGRNDQVSASFGFDLIRTSDARRTARLSAGSGFRSSGEYAGQRMQNGYHRLIDNAPVMRPYTATQRTAATAWADAEYFRALSEPLRGDWRLGAWGRANSLLTSDGQWDGSAGLYAVANRRSLDLWLGLRRDWRSGYEDPVQRKAAVEEDDLAVVFGLRFGALVIETVQQVNNRASYGQVRLVSSGERRRGPAGKPPRFGIAAGFLLPDVQLHVAGRVPSSLLGGARSGWRESVFVSIDYGEPQHRDNDSVFVRSTQFGAGLEWERPLAWQGDWLSAYVSAGAGYRDERLVGDVALRGRRSAAAGSAVLLGGAGVRADASRLGLRWNLRVQLGLFGRLPVDSTDLEIGRLTLPAQEAGLDALLGMTFDFD